jgi:hypothetical protein
VFIINIVITPINIIPNKEVLYKICTKYLWMVVTNIRGSILSTQHEVECRMDGS